MSYFLAGVAFGAWVFGSIGFVIGSVMTYTTTKYDIPCRDICECGIADCGNPDHSSAIPGM